MALFRATTYTPAAPNATLVKEHHRHVTPLLDRESEDPICAGALSPRPEQGPHPALAPRQPMSQELERDGSEVRVKGRNHVE